LLSDERFHSSNLEIVKTILRNNCYPADLVNKKIKDRLITIKKNKISEERKTNDNNDISKTIMVPFVKGISNGIKRIVKNCVNVRFSIPKKLDSIIKRGKINWNSNRIRGWFTDWTARIANRFILDRQNDT